jgi:hypothetical protein
MIDAMKQALEALEWIVKVNAMDYEYKQKAAEPITALRQAIAEAENQDPVAAEQNRCINIIENYQIPVGNSSAGEIACEMTYAALRDIRDQIRGRTE